MKIKINFGLIISKEIPDYWGSVEGFPPFLSLNGVKYEFVFYDKDPNKYYDHVFTFVEIPKHDPNFYKDILSWEERFSHLTPTCDCGARHTTFPQFHMFFCRKWKPWNQL